MQFVLTNSIQACLNFQESHEQKDTEGKNAEDVFVRRNTKPSRPASKKEKLDDADAGIPVFKIDDVEMKSVEEELTSVLSQDETPTPTVEVPTLDISMDIDEPVNFFLTAILEIFKNEFL